MARSSPSSLFPILLVNFIGTLGYSIVLPFLVAVVIRFGGNAVLYGVAGATYSAFQLIGAPILGKWSDVYGRRKVLLLSQVGTLLSWCVFLFAFFLPLRPLMRVELGGSGVFVLTLPLVVLFIARAADGLTGGNVSVANAYLADLTEENEREKNFGKMAVATNLGFILGPILAGLLGVTAIGEVLPVLAAIAISLAASLIIGFYLPESKPCVLRRSPERTNVRKVFGQEHKDCFRLKPADRTSLKDALGIANIPFLLCIYFLIFLGFNLFYAAFPVHALSSLEWSTAELGVFFSFLGLTTVMVQGPLLSRLADKCSAATLAIVGGLFLGAGFLLLTSTRLPFLYLGAALFSLGNGLQWPSFMTILSKVAGSRHQGAVQGFGGSVGSLASIVGLLLGGLLYSRLGGSIFLVSAVLIFVVSVLSFKLRSLDPKQRRR
jgi:MFS family permease